mmetsp:Transcript_21905/g.52629  ORF Transcript_21905/g.52629 Transcript_21905/m.52629 type:complete len:207 (+) Transcript_21905:522-1142(+)
MRRWNSEKYCGGVQSATRRRSAAFSVMPTPNAFATAARVTSVCAGPTPPATKMWRCTGESLRSRNAITSKSLSISNTCLTAMPLERSIDAMKWELVSRTAPESSSSPTTITAAVSPWSIVAPPAISSPSIVHFWRPTSSESVAVLSLLDIVDARERPSLLSSSSSHAGSHSPASSAPTSPATPTVSAASGAEAASAWTGPPWDGRP